MNGERDIVLKVLRARRLHQDSDLDAAMWERGDPPASFMVGADLGVDRPCEHVLNDRRHRPDDRNSGAIQ